MSCPDQETLSTFADSELDASECADIQRHLSTCAPCREFVDEMLRLDACGRSSLRSIQVPERRRSVVILESATKPRWLGFAAAAVILVSLTVVIWFFAFRGERSSLVAVETPESGDTFQGSSDEAFERWAEPYRRLRIPLVPLEEVANAKPPDIVPVVPETSKRNDKI